MTSASVLIYHVITANLYKIMILYKMQRQVIYHNSSPYTGPFGAQVKASASEISFPFICQNFWDEDKRLKVIKIVFIFMVTIITFWPICPSAFFRFFMSNSVAYTEPRSEHFRCLMSHPGAYTEPWTEPFIHSTGVDCSNSINHDWV